jgi:dipeptidyl aminopeptidase/acylaminoacyl peptidase
VQFQSEGETVVGRLYRLKDLKAPAPAIVVLPGRGRDFAGMEWLYKPLAQKGYVVMPIGFRDIPVRYYLEDVKDARNAMTYMESLLTSTKGGWESMDTHAAGRRRS